MSKSIDIIIPAYNEELTIAETLRDFGSSSAIHDGFRLNSWLLRHQVQVPLLGSVIILVPAGPWAFGRLDERLGHYRRYSKSYSRGLFAEVGLRIELMRYDNFVGIWGWWWNAKMGKLEGQSDAQIRLFDRWVVPIVSRIERLICPPVGQSILVVSENPE